MALFSSRRSSFAGLTTRTRWPDVVGGDVFSRDLLAALFDVDDFADVAAMLKDRKSLRDFAFGSMGYCFAEIGIALAANGIQAGDQHSGLLHLIDWPPRFDRMMLALVADEDDPLHALLARLVEEPVDLPRGE